MDVAPANQVCRRERNDLHVSDDVGIDESAFVLVFEVFAAYPLSPRDMPVALCG